MPYSVPETWEHGDFPTAAKMNRYKDGLDAIFARTGSYSMNLAVQANSARINGYYLVNAYRWLIYLGAGAIEDPSGIGEPVSLSGDGANWVTHDLFSIDWMIAGKLYEVSGVTACLEDYEAL